MGKDGKVVHPAADLDLELVRVFDEADLVQQADDEVDQPAHGARAEDDEGHEHGDEGIDAEAHPRADADGRPHGGLLDLPQRARQGDHDDGAEDGPRQHLDAVLDHRDRRALRARDPLLVQVVDLHGLPARARRRDVLIILARQRHLHVLMEAEAVPVAAVEQGVFEGIADEGDDEQGDDDEQIPPV